MSSSILRKSPQSSCGKAPKPAKPPKTIKVVKPAKTINVVKVVTFGSVKVKIITPEVEDSTDDGFAAMGFSTIGTIGTTVTVTVGATVGATGGATGGVPGVPLVRRACAPISASRIVQRRWRSSAQSGR
jgi:hypothetical protein